jgi:hypothetical protein
MARLPDEFICYLMQPPVDDRMAVRVVLWPVHVWQVYGPDVSGKSTNIFERSLLSLLSMRTGKRLDAARIAELAEWHGLEPEMVTYIIEQQLEPKGWVDQKTGWLTEDGHKALQEDLPGSNSLRTGYVFQDAFEGGLLPRYSNDLKVVEPSVSSDTSLEFAFSKASNWKWKPTLIREKHEPVIPSKADLRHVMEATHQAQRNAWMMGDLDDFDSFRQLDALRLSDKESFPAFLWVWVYTGSGLEHVWAAADPFGLHADVQWMREKVEGACRSVPKLSRNIMRMIGVDEHDEFSSLRDVLAAREEQARLEVLTEYSQADQVDGLIGLLHGWTNRKLEIETSEFTDRFHDYRDLITQSSSLIEHCVRYCLGRFPLNNPQIIPRNCRSVDLQRLITDAMPSLSSEQLQEVTKVKPSTVYSAAVYKQGSFRRCLAACLLSMPDYPNHPIRGFVEAEQLFLDAYRLSHWRDDSAHGDTQFNISKSMSLEAASTTASFLKIFFKGLTNGQKEKSE